jgi:hypothetical protein
MRSALNAVFEHLAGSESRNLFGGDSDLFAGLGVQALTSGTLTGLKRTKPQDGNFFAFDNRIDDRFDGSVDYLRDIGFGQLSASCDQVDQISFVH